MNTKYTNDVADCGIHTYESMVELYTCLDCHKMMGARAAALAQAVVSQENTLVHDVGNMPRPVAAWEELVILAKAYLEIPATKNRTK